MLFSYIPGFEELNNTLKRYRVAKCGCSEYESTSFGFISPGQTF
jgi:hypothetical protein